MKASTKILFALAISFLAFGIIEGSNRGVDLSFVHGVIIAILVFSWCKAHARENDIFDSSGYRILAAVLPPIGVPIFYYRFYGLKSGSIKLLRFLGFGLLLWLFYSVPYEMFDIKYV